MKEKLLTPLLHGLVLLEMPMMYGLSMPQLKVPLPQRPRLSPVNSPMVEPSNLDTSSLVTLRNWPDKERPPQPPKNQLPL